MGIPVIVAHMIDADGTSEAVITNIDDGAGYRLFLIVPDDDADPNDIYVGNVDESKLVASGTVTDNELRMTFDTPGEYAIWIDAIEDSDPANPYPLLCWETRIYASEP